MKTRCPACQTVFRVAPEQVKVRAGKVRCGECNEIFNALDHLLEDNDSLMQSGETTQIQGLKPEEETVAFSFPSEIQPSTFELTNSSTEEREESEACGARATAGPNEAAVMPPADEERPIATAESTMPAEEGIARPASTDDLILPRETTQIPGYSKWAEGVMSTSTVPTVTKVARWPFFTVAVILSFILAGQVVFFFRTEIATALPSFRPAVERFASILDAGVPLPRHVDLISIEASDLQSDPARSNLLVLNATLRNRANYAQEYPALELSLTDTHDAAIARRVFRPADYLSDEARAKPFAANGDVALRLWIEAKEISAAGYRLYVFYP